MLNLNTSEDYKKLIDSFDKFAKLYIKIKNCENNYNNDFKYVYYNSQLGFTLQSQLLLAPICYEDKDDVINQKIDLVSKYIDMLIYSRAINYKSCDYSTIKNYVFDLTKKIRRLSVNDLSKVLVDSYNSLDYNFAGLEELRLNGFTKKYIKHMLARVTAFIEESCDTTSNFVNYVNRDLKNPYEVEHITPDHYEWYITEYSSPVEFTDNRNRIGDLLLLPKSINASLNDKKYDYKVKKYCSNEGNIYAASLGQITYTNNPRFTNFIRNNNLNFKPYESFGKEQIHERFKLVLQLVDLIWNVRNLKIKK
jgi:hypothetical protein